jgi:hypothetical protein
MNKRPGKVIACFFDGNVLDLADSLIVSELILKIFASCPDCYLRMPCPWKPGTFFETRFDCV